MFVNPGFEGLKIVSARKDGGREGVPVVCQNIVTRKLRKIKFASFSIYFPGNPKIVLKLDKLN